MRNFKKFSNGPPYQSGHINQTISPAGQDFLGGCLRSVVSYLDCVVSRLAYLVNLFIGGLFNYKTWIFAFINLYFMLGLVLVGVVAACYSDILNKLAVDKGLRLKEYFVSNF